MKSLKWILLALALVASALAWKQNTQVQQAREHLRDTQSKLAEARQLEATNAQLRGISVSVEEMAKVRESTADLHKLRNEVRQLREAVSEAEKLKLENARLLDSIAQAKAGQPVRPPGFIERSAMANVGQATPEAAIQKYFWALIHTNGTAIVECAPPEKREEMKAFFSQDDPEYAERMALYLDQFANFQGFHIAERKDVSDSEVELTIGGTSMAGSVQPILIRIGENWYLKK